VSGLAATERARPLDPGAFSLLEIVFVLALATTISAIAIPPLLSALDDLRAIGAVRYVSARLQEARMHAVTTSRETGVRFLRGEGRYVFGVYTDGNGNGIRAADVQSGIDAPLRMPECLADGYAGVDFGALPGLPAVDPSGSPPGADPIRLGSSDIVSFTPLGTATPGSLYILGRHGAQYVIRIFAETGKTRMLKFDRQAYVWKPL
jgi:type II secretory pathway pseudopilin PulG